MKHYITLMFGLGKTVQSKWALGFALVVTTACASDPLDRDNSAPSGGASGGNVGTMCSAALRQALSLVERASLAQVRVLSQGDDEMLIYVDATTGGIERQQTEPWVYLSLATGERVALTDFEALESKSWDLAFKRAVLRTNSGDSGPGLGGAIGVQSSWAGLDLSRAQTLDLQSESWFDSECNLLTDAAGGVMTTFSAWNVYDEATHTLAPAPGVLYALRGGEGKLYKLQILDYYSNADGTTGARDGGNYRFRVAPLR
jgi:hypothetical protein